MGERLNIEIHKNGKVLANCYYHWSGYTNSAAELAQQIINEITSNSNNLKSESDLLYAIRLLELTGGGLNQEEITYAKTIEEIKDIEFSPCTGRNEGLIAISPKAIMETRYWQEHALYIYLDEERMSFKVFWKTGRWDWEHEQKEYDNSEIKSDDLEKIDINFDDIKFKNINSFVEFINAHLEDSFTNAIDGYNEVYTSIY